MHSRLTKSSTSHSLDAPSKSKFFNFIMLVYSVNGLCGRWGWRGWFLRIIILLNLSMRKNCSLLLTLTCLLRRLKGGCDHSYRMGNAFQQKQQWCQWQTVFRQAVNKRKAKRFGWLIHVNWAVRILSSNNNIVIITLKRTITFALKEVPVGNGYDDASSNPRRDWLHFT